MSTFRASPSVVACAPTRRCVSNRFGLLVMVGALLAATSVFTWFSQDAKAVDVPVVNGDVYATAPDGLGGAYIGGTFTQVDGLTRLHAAHILADGTVDPQWHPDPTGSGGDWVYSIAVSGSTVYLGGAFWTVGGASHPHLAAVGTDGTVLDWTPAPFNLEESVWHGFVTALAVSGSTLYVGGQFDHIGTRADLSDPAGAVARSRFAAINTADGSVTSWNPGGAGVNGRPWAIVAAGSYVYVGGEFTEVNGQPRNHLARLTTGGTLDGTWTPSIIGFDGDPWVNVTSLDISDDAVYVGGWFAKVGDATRNYVAALSPVDGSALPWHPVLDHGGAAVDVVDSTVYIGGGFEHVDGVPRAHAAAIDEDGTLEEWNPNLLDGVNSITVSGGNAFLGLHPSWGDDAHSIGLAIAPVMAPTPDPTPTPTPTPSPASSPATPSTPAEPEVFSPAPGITVGETRGEAILAPSVPAAGADLLRGANIWVRPTSKVEFIADALPAGLKLVDGKLVASKPGTYQVKLLVKRANGTTVLRKIKVKVG